MCATELVLGVFTCIGNPMQFFKKSYVATLYSSKYWLVFVKLHLHKLICVCVRACVCDGWGNKAIVKSPCMNVICREAELGKL
jgi:hypothetical protein